MADLSQKKNIIVAGAGFGGLFAARTLDRLLSRHHLRKTARIILVDQHGYHLYAPALYEIAAIPREKINVAVLKRAVGIPIEDIIRKTSIRFLQDTITGIDHARKQITLRDGGTLTYEILVMALGAETNYFDIPGLKKYSLPLKSFEDAIRVRNHIEELAKKNTSSHVVIGGGGATGVEFAAECTNFICTLEKIYQQKRLQCHVAFTLVETLPDILSGFPPSVAVAARRRLVKLGVGIRTSSIISRVEEQKIVFQDGSSLPYDFFVWAGGVKGPELFTRLNLPLTKKGNFAVNHYLEAAPGCYAIGDAAGFTHPLSGKPLPWNATVAEQEGAHVAKNIICTLEGKPQKTFMPWRHYPAVLTLGGKNAIADLVWFVIQGFLGWNIKMLVELKYLMTILPPLKAVRLWFRAIRVYRMNDEEL